MGAQDPASIAKNKEFFTGNRAYEEQVARLDTYRNVRAALDREVAGLERVLDVGAGGVFDYDTSLVDQIVALDLFIDELPDGALPPNVTARRGDALALPEPACSYDGVLMIFLFHHLVGSGARELIANVRRSLDEAARVLQPGGKLVVAESCVPRWFYALETVLFSPLALVARTPLLRHPATLQLPFEHLRALVAERFEIERAEPIPAGRWLLQFGFKWPTALTPARPYLLTARKR